VSNDDFRRDLNRAFDDLSGSPSSNLADRVRSAVNEAPRVREPYWIAGVAAAIIAVLIVGVLFVANPFRQPPSTVGALHSPSPTASATATPTVSPSVQPFMCSVENFAPKPGSSTAPPVAYIAGLRTGAHTGYDRLTVEFANGEPGQVEIRFQTGTTFTLSPSGMQTTLKGENGILVVIHGADLHTSYNGSIDIVTGYAGLAEVKRVEDFEGVVQIGLGVNGYACAQAYFLTNPDRLVIDVRNG
jgi:hypothetical protein